LEAGDMPLEKSLELFERGVALSDSCGKQLEAAETRVEVLVKRGTGLRAEPFKPTN
jgi:exodeoxyribonuclease VII small subunit